MHYYISFYLPSNPYDISQPPTYIQSNISEYNSVLAHRGETYGTLTHLLLVLIVSFSYLIIRLGIVQLTTQNKTTRFFSPVLVTAAHAGYELLLLYPYTLLAVGGTVRLNYFPTGIAHASLITRSFGFVSDDYSFPYLRWRFLAN